MDVLVFALFALSVHVLVNQKHVGYVLVLLLVVPLIAELLGIEHPLLILGSEPGWRHSPISGFGPFVGPVLWFEQYWAAWALLVALVARLFPRAFASRTFVLPVADPATRFIRGAPTSSVDMYRT